MAGRRSHTLTPAQRARIQTTLVDPLTQMPVSGKPKRAPKYGMKKCIDPQTGEKYDSPAEMHYHRVLKLRVKAGELALVERQVVYPLIVNGQKIGIYTIDFRLTHPGGHVELVEVKGVPTEAWSLRDRVFEASYCADHPEVEYWVWLTSPERRRLKRWWRTMTIAW